MTAIFELLRLIGLEPHRHIEPTEYRFSVPILDSKVLYRAFAAATTGHQVIDGPFVCVTSYQRLDATELECRVAVLRLPEYEDGSSLYDDHARVPGIAAQARRGVSMYYIHAWASCRVQQRHRAL